MSSAKSHVPEPCLGSREPLSARRALLAPCEAVSPRGTGVCPRTALERSGGVNPRAHGPRSRSSAPVGSVLAGSFGSSAVLSRCISPQVNYWHSDQCNMINGTSGQMWAPFMTPEYSLEFYSPEACR